MKILHLTNSKKGGAAIYAINNIKSMSDNHSNTLCSFRSFLFFGFLDLTFFNIFNLLSYSLLKFFKRKYVRVIPPDYSIWNKEKLIKYFKNFDEIIVYRFTNFLSFQELVLISKCTSKLTLFAVDPSIFRAGCYFAYDCKILDKECKNCKSKFYDNNLKNIIENHNWSNTKIIFSNSLEKKQFENSYWKQSGISASYKIYGYKASNSVDEINSLKLKLFDSLEEKFIISISSLHSTRRKGFHLIAPFIFELDKKILKFHKKVTINIISRNPDIFKRKLVKIKNIKINFLPVQKSIQFEKKLINSHLFISFSLADSGPFILNMCHFLKTPVISFNVGVAKDLKLVNNSFFISENYNLDQHLNYTLKLINLNKSNYCKLINKSDEI